jgi:Peptidase inhibitor family I36
VVAVAAPASAAGKDGTCESEEFCLYYGEGYTGWVFDLYQSDRNFNNDYFADTNTRADNNTRSYWNRDDYYWYVYKRSGYQGGYYCVSPGDYGNLPSDFWDAVSSARYSSEPC